MASFLAILPILKMLLELFIKTPEEKLGEVSTNISRYLSEIKDGVQHLKENKGDTSKLEDALNGARRRSK